LDAFRVPRGAALRFRTGMPPADAKEATVRAAFLCPSVLTLFIDNRVTGAFPAGERPDGQQVQRGD
jgi:hypothetical protein